MEVIVVVLCILFILYKTCRPFARRKRKRIIYTSYHRKPEVFRGNVSNFQKKNCDDYGLQSEIKIKNSLINYGIPQGAIFHNLIIKNGRGKSAQIDIVVATKVGLIVFEIKNYAGWIFGKGKENKWTQSLKCDYRYKRYGYKKERCKTYRFYNPVLQNDFHIKALQEQSEQFKNLPFYSVIVFDGDCELRDVSFIPKGTFVIKPHRLHDVLDIIFANAKAEYTDKREVMKILKSAVDNGNDANVQTEHVKNVKDMLGKDRVLD